MKKNVFCSVPELIKSISNDEEFNNSVIKLIIRKETMTELKKRIKDAKISRKELAKKIGVRYTTLSGYLNDFIPMPDDVREKIEEVLNCYTKGNDNAEKYKHHT